MGKGEIARYEQFSFSHSVFKRLVSQGRQKVSLCWNGLIWRGSKLWLGIFNPLPDDNSLPFSRLKDNAG